MKKKTRLHTQKQKKNALVKLKRFNHKRQEFVHHQHVCAVMKHFFETLNEEEKKNAIKLR